MALSYKKCLVELAIISYRQTGAVWKLPIQLVIINLRCAVLKNKYNKNNAYVILIMSLINVPFECIYVMKC